MRLYFKELPTHEAFYKFIEEVNPYLDSETMFKSANRKTFTKYMCLADHEGRIDYLRNLKQMCNILNRDYGFSLSSAKSYTRGDIVLLYSYDIDYLNTKVHHGQHPHKDKEEVVVDVVNETPAEEGESKEGEKDFKSVLPNEAKEDTKDFYPDLDPAVYKELYKEGDISGSKDRLQLQVKKDFGIVLKKNRKFDDMISDLYTIKETGSFE